MIPSCCKFTGEQFEQLQLLISIFNPAQVLFHHAFNKPSHPDQVGALSDYPNFKALILKNNLD